MRLIVAVTIVFLLVVWIAAGRPLNAWLDRMATLPAGSWTLTSIRYDGGGFRAAEVSLSFVGVDNNRYPLELVTGVDNRVTLVTGGRTFVLGPRTNPVDPKGRPEIDIIPDTGDRVTLTARRSLTGWPTPFEYNLIGPQTPWWRRNVIYQLNWYKPAGESLSMTWRYEQTYRFDTAWTEPQMLYQGNTGLLTVRLTTGH